MRAYATLSAILAGIIGCNAPAGTVTAPIHIRQEASHFFLENGLEVLVDPSAGAEFALRMRYHRGSADDPRGKEGLAHLAEHIAGSTCEPGGYATDMFEARVGARDGNATTSSHATDYFATFPTGAFDAALWHERERIRCSHQALPESALTVERRAVRNELRWRATGVGLAQSLVVAGLYPEGHPYAKTLRSDWRALDGITRADVESHLRNTMLANDATLVVAGAVPRDFESHIRRWLSDAPSGPSHREPAAVLAEEAAHHSMTIRMDIPEPHLMVAWLLEPDDSESYRAMSLASELITVSTQWGKLEERALTSGAQVTLHGDRLGGHLLVDIANPSKERDRTLRRLEDTLTDACAYFDPDDAEAERLKLATIFAGGYAVPSARAAWLANEFSSPTPARHGLQGLLDSWWSLPSWRVREACTRNLVRARRIVADVLVDATQRDAPAVEMMR